MIFHSIMVKPSTLLYHIIGIISILLTKENPDGSFAVIRGRYRDKFVNPQCENQNCTLTSCETFNATCDSRGCGYCVCNKQNQSTTYFPQDGSATGKCMEDSLIARQSGKSNMVMQLFRLKRSCEDYNPKS